MTNASPTALLLNVGHALDHLSLLIFATAVTAIAAEWGMIWQDLMPYTVGAFVLLGVSSLAVYLLGPTVKAAGFTTLLTVLAVLAACTTFFASLLPTYAPKPTVVPAPTPEPAT